LKLKKNHLSNIRIMMMSGNNWW